MPAAIYTRKGWGTLRRVVPFVLVVVTLGCARQRDAEDVAALFASRRVGDSRDAGLYKRASIADRVGEWDHVATIHGMADDMDFCETLVEALKVRSSADQYSCRLLN